MTARLGFWIALVLVGLGAGVWLMAGRVEDAHSAAVAAERRALDLEASLSGYAQRIETIEARQAATDETVGARSKEDEVMQAQLFELNRRLLEAIRNDPESSSWASGCVPGAVAVSLRLPADPGCAVANLP